MTFSQKAINQYSALCSSFSSFSFLYSVFILPSPLGSLLGLALPPLPPLFSRDSIMFGGEITYINTPRTPPPSSSSPCSSTKRTNTRSTSSNGGTVVVEMRSWAEIVKESRSRRRSDKNKQGAATETTMAAVGDANVGATRGAG